MEYFTTIPGFTIRIANESDVPLIYDFILKLAAYEKLSDAVKTTQELLTESLFGKHRVAESVIGFEHGKPVGFALFFHNYSTFVGKKGLYLEDLFVLPEMRGKGFGKELFLYLARLAKERDCGRFEWSVLKWNTPAIEFYKKMGAVDMDDWSVYRLTQHAIDNLVSGK